MLSPKENYLAAIRFDHPEYVPRGNEDYMYWFQLEGNFRMADWSDLWGVDWEVGLADTVPFSKGNPLPDIEKLAEYHFPNPDDLVFTDAHREGIKKARKEGKIVLGCLFYLLFERACPLMGMDNFLAALALNPDEVHELLHGIARYNRRVFDRYLELGVDAVSFSEDLGTQRALMMSPTMFREFFLPEYQYMFENVLAEGKIINFHSCGCVDAIAGDLAELGVTILNPIQAKANNLPQMKADTMGRMALCGGIDTYLLQTGTPAKVRQEVIRVMEILKPGGGYICTPDQSIPGIPEENMRALWDTAEEIGRY